MKPGEKPEPPTPVEIEVRESKPPTPPKTAGRTSRAHKGGHRSHAASSFPGWSQLKVPGDFGVAHEIAQPHSFTDEDTSGWSPDQWGAGGGSGLAHVGHTLHFDKLITEVEGMLNYPGVLAHHGYEGTVNARLAFGPHSRCDWQRTKIFGGHRYFQIYILALLKKLCGLETIEHIGFDDRQTIDLSFRFAFDQVVKDPDFYGSGRVVGNVILFTRIAPRVPLQYHIGPLTGSFLAPAVLLDWPWVLEHWDKWVEGKDPMREFRDPN